MGRDVEAGSAVLPSVGLALGALRPDRPSHEARALILIRLWARTPCPAQILAPSLPSMRVRSHPYPRLRVLILPSHPVRHLMVLRNAGRCSSARRTAEGLPLRGITTLRTPRSCRSSSTPFSP